MKLKKLLTISLVTFSLSACKTAPTKPQVQLCVIDTKSQKCFCSITNTEKLKTADDLTYKATMDLIASGAMADEYPIDYCHKAIAFRPVNWAILQDYVHDLENYIKYQCK